MTQDQDEIEAFQQARRRRGLVWVMPYAVVVAIVGAVMAYVALFGTPLHKIGETCTKTEDCDGARATCLVAAEASYCSLNCTSATECPAGWKCALADNIDRAGRGTGAMMKVCTK